jgi:glutaredoxin
MREEVRDYAKKMAGKKKVDLFLFTLSTCVWCMKTKKLLKDLGVEYSYIDVDLVEDNIREEVIREFNRWNPKQSFPTIVVNNKDCIIGFQEDKIRELAK